MAVRPKRPMPTSPLRINRGGMTLIEIMVTLAIVGLVLGITISQVGGTFDSHARQGMRELSAIIRYLYNKAASENLTMRIAFDLEKQSYVVEATSDLFLLESEEAKQERLKKEKEATSSLSKDTKSADGKTETSATKAEANFGAVDSHLLKPTPLPGGVFFKDVQTEHDKEPVTRGLAYIYIFPNGYVERAIVNFRNEDDSEKRALVINPITGDSRVFDDYKELKK